MDIHSKNCWFFQSELLYSQFGWEKIKNFVLAAMSQGYAELERCIPSLEICPCNKFMLCSDKVGDLLLAPFIVTCNWCIHKLLWSILLWIMAIIITRTAAVILHYGSQYYHSLRHGIYQLTEVKSKSVSLCWTISDNYLKTTIRSLLPLSHLWRIQHFVKSVASEIVTILIILFTWSRMLWSMEINTKHCVPVLLLEMQDWAVTFSDHERHCVWVHLTGFLD